MQTHFDFILAYEPQLRGVCRKSCCGQYHLLDEIWSDVVLHYVENALASYNAAKGQTVEQHVFHTIRWNVLKWLRRRHNKYEREPLAGDLRELERVADKSTIIASDMVDAISAREWVQTILEGLPEYERRLLHLRYVLEWTYVDIADKLGCAESTARKHCDAALVLAKRIASAMQ